MIMMTSSYLHLVIALLLLCSAVQAFHCTHVSKPLARSVLTTKSDPFYGHWRLVSTELRNENAFSKAPLSTSRPSSSKGIRSIFRTERTQVIPTAKELSTGYINNRQYLKAASIQATSKAARKLKRASQSLTTVQWSDAFDQALRFVLQYWWSIPAFLALVPIYSTYFAGAEAMMPQWWSVTRMDHILKAPDAAMVLSVFLGSNIAFFLSGGYLMKKFPLVQAHEVRAIRKAATSQTLPPFLLGLATRLQALKIIPTRQTWLGILLLLSGLISTIFHTEQALGSFSVANSLCFVDHAVAGTSTFYFFHTCGKPSKRVWALGIAGLAALSIVPPHPLPGYAWLHSMWHFLASGAAVLWAIESFDSPQNSTMVQPLP